jgi:peptidoglycan L-alanyl-D-glutamate endopeptidase CwlK
MYKLGKASNRHLTGGKPDIVAVVRRAIQITGIDFSVVDVLRTVAEQAHYVKTGKSWTMNSRHLPDTADGLAFAVDIYPYYEGKTQHRPWMYRKIAKAMFRAAIELGVDIEWGGFWKGPDMPHWQLSRARYPKAPMQLNG